MPKLNSFLFFNIYKALAKTLKVILCKESVFFVKLLLAPSTNAVFLDEDADMGHFYKN